MSSLQQPYFETVTEALQWLNGQGFTENFNLDSDCIRYNNNTLSMSPEDFKIEYLFRFEGDTDPGDEDIVYGIISDVYNVKGVLTSAFGIYADSISAEMIKKLSTH
ncbi:phosphoribosylpyrophosphate synthetase [Flavobacterium sharifuzzamanii]|uniref:phosphoribosylpyrophosphate synthetase n=1 Tax=Flavobacterium sharifuzzamanii TaxID=2211133 RepID=UPI000DAE9650|nr:phosphoribosylpyrophosphate synthetase [Flavobacterium sharifuzzamanii]KAF2080678.1 phosphoribosylpyrophosphate synthetase [Flavobacterium sharifuzzamanii]